MSRIAELSHESDRLERAMAAVRRVSSELDLTFTVATAEAEMDDIAPALDALLVKLAAAHDATQTEIARLQDAAPVVSRP